MKLLAKIEDSFVLASIAPGYGCSVVIKFVAEDGRIRPKDAIQLRTPDGRVKDTYVAGIEHVKYRLDFPVDQRKPSIALPPEIGKEDVPSGTEIWIADGASSG